MIYSVDGIVAHKEASYAVIECNGVGYLIKTSMISASQLPPVGEKAKMFTYMHVREDAMELYGFTQLSELDTFKMLITVSGVGPKAALAVLSELTVEQFALCVTSGDAKRIAKSQGVGPKTAQRIILELKDKVSKQMSADNVSLSDSFSSATAATGNVSEAISALEVLGYSRSEANKVVSGFDKDMPVDEMIKNALKALAGKV